MKNLSYYIAIMVIASVPLIGAAQPYETVETKGGATFQTQEVYGEWTLPIRGYLLLEWWGFDVYSIAFYCPEDKKGEADILSGETPRKLIIKYHRSISADDLEKATEKNIEKIEGADMSALRKRLNTLYDSYRDVSEGDVYTVTYVPDKKVTRLYLNGERTTELEGEDFARAFFGIWVSDDGMNDDMAETLRGE